MRETKFRALFVADNEWCYFTLKQLGILGTAYINYKHWSQYTGLKDKNGVGIYEGDIVRFKHWELLGKPSRIGEVRFYQDGMKWNLYSGDNSFTSFHKHDDREYEVIDNIYQSPDLLANKNELNQTKVREDGDGTENH